MNNGVQISYDDTCMSVGANFQCGQEIPAVGWRGTPKRDFVITLTNGLKTSEILWLSLYCRRAKQSFGDIIFMPTPGN